MASTSLTIFDTGRISKLSAMMLAGVLACSSVMSPPVLAQDAAATQGETAEAADPTAEPGPRRRSAGSLPGHDG